MAVCALEWQMKFPRPSEDAKSLSSALSRGLCVRLISRRCDTLTPFSCSNSKSLLMPVSVEE